MKKIAIVSILSIITCLSMFNSCTYKSKEELLAGVTCDTTGITYTSTIQQLVTTHCNAQSGCHGASPGSVSLITYQNVKDNVDNVMSEIESGGMPKGASKLDICTISKFQTWVNHGAPQN